MERIVYVNGEYVAESDAKISIFDRGFLFSDAVYEVMAVLDGQLLEVEGHLARLKHSSEALFLSLPVTPDELIGIHKELIKRNDMHQGAIYLQLSRGSEGDRVFGIHEGLSPTLVLFTQEREVVKSKQAETGISVISVPDIRWKMRDIKTTGLLAACLAKKQAYAAGADDVFWVEDGHITEGGSSNAYIVTKEGKIITKPLGQDILPGITRSSLLKCMDIMDVELEERPFTLEEAYDAAEAFISSATSFVWPVVSIDGKAVGDGKVGPIATKLREVYLAESYKYIEQNK